MSKNFEVVNLYDACVILLKMKGNRYEFNREIAKIKRAVEGDYSTIIEELDLIKKESTELTLEYCEKDKNGKPLFQEVKNENGEVIGKMYDGLLYGQCPEYDKRVKSLNESKKEFLKSESNLEISNIEARIKKSDLPLKNEDFDGELQDQIQPFIDD